MFSVYEKNYNLLTISCQVFRDHNPRKSQHNNNLNVNNKKKDLQSYLACYVVNFFFGEFL